MHKENLGDYYTPPTATAGEIERARDMIGRSDDINIDEDAIVSIVEPDEDGLGGGYWIQAWVWVPTGIQE